MTNADAIRAPAHTADTSAGTLSLIDRALSSHGYWVGRAEEPGRDCETAILELARALGDLYVPEGCEPASPILWTRPTLDVEAPPFDRREPIGWHGDFASHEDRPEISLVYVSRPDPAGGMAGAWRLASVARLIEHLDSTAEGREAIAYLSEESLPFSYAEGKPVRWFRVIDAGLASGSVGLRFYEPSILRGCLAVHGRVPDAVARCLRTVKAAADHVQEVRPTETGSILVIDNWHALHDRIEQSVTGGKDREALLAFVAQRN